MEQSKVVSGTFKANYGMVAGRNDLVYSFNCCYIHYNQGIEIECKDQNNISVWKKTYITALYDHFNVQFMSATLVNDVANTIEIYGICTDGSVVRVLTLNSLTGAAILTNNSTIEYTTLPVNTNTQPVPNERILKQAFVSTENSAYKFDITVETSKVTYTIRVLNDGDLDRIIFEVLNDNDRIIREVKVPSCDRVVVDRVSSVGIILVGYLKDQKQYRYYCDVYGSINFQTPDMFESN